MRPLAVAALRQFGVEDASVSLLNHGFNSTFAVTQNNGLRFALRLNTNSHRSVEELKGELAWVRALGSQTALEVPAPQPTLEGGFLATIANTFLGKDMHAVLYSWLSGPLAGDRMNPVIANAFGGALRVLHNHAAKFKFPTGAELQPLKNSLFNRSYTLDQNAPALDHSLFRDVYQEADLIMARVMKEPLIPIHYDLHPGNAKWLRGKLSVFDFDDSMLGRPILDFAISSFYLRNKGVETDAAMWDGAKSSPNDHGVTRQEFETLVAARGVGLANELFSMNTADLIEIAPKYAVVVEKRLEHFKKTGVFDPTVAKLSS
ncbi:MAG: phosphotransferase [Fimbriimonadaceae bacterium]